MSHPALPRIVLASASPRRRDLIARLGLPIEIAVSGVDETPDPALGIIEVARTLAEAKARAVAAGLGNRSGLVIGADTVVTLDGDLFGKPADDAEARAMLRRLAGRTHEVITGIAVVDAATGAADVDAVASRVTMRALDDEEIAAYAATGEPRDKAGAYAIQGEGGALVARFDGCYAAIVGLPLCALAAALRRAGVELPATGPVCRGPDGRPCPRVAAPAR